MDTTTDRIHPFAQALVEVASRRVVGLGYFPSGSADDVHEAVDIDDVQRAQIAENIHERLVYLTEDGIVELEDRV